MITRVQTWRRRRARATVIALAVGSILGSAIGLAEATADQTLEPGHLISAVENPRAHEPKIAVTISRISSATASGTSVTLGTHQAGDLLVFLAVRGASATAPTPPTNVRVLSVFTESESTSVAVSMVVGYKIATSSSETSGTWTNANEMIGVVYRAPSGYTLRIGQGAVHNSTTNTVNFPALSPMGDSASGNSWVLGFIGASNLTQSVATAPSGMTNVTSVAGASYQAALHDTNAGVSSWASTNATLTGTAGKTVSGTLEIALAPTAAGIWATNVYQHAGGGGKCFQSGLTGNTYVIPLPLKSGAGNTIVFAMTYDDGVAVSSISGAVNGSFGSPAVTAVTGGPDADSAVYVLPNIAAGQETITVVFASAVTVFQYCVTEYYGVATTFTATSGTTVQSTADATTQPAQTGSLTPPNNNATGGNLIHAYFCKVEQTPSLITSALFPSANFTLLNADIFWGGPGTSIPKGTTAYVQTTSAAINPGLASMQDTGNSWNALAVVLKISAGTGTAPPTGIQLGHIDHFATVTWPSAGTVAMQAPSSGNLRVVNSPDQNLNAITVTDSEGNTWTPDTAGAGFWYQAATSPNPNLLVFISGGGTDTFLSWRFRDISGAATSPYDSSGKTTQSLNSATSFTLSPSPSPSAAPGLTVIDIGLFTGPGLAVTAPTGAVWDLCTYTSEVDADTLENADIAAHLNYSATGAQIWTFTISSQNPNSAQAGFIVFKAPTIGGAWQNFSAPGRRGPRRTFPRPAYPAVTVRTLTSSLTATQAEVATLGPNQVGVNRSVTQAESPVLAKAISHKFATVTQASTATLVKQVSHLFATIAQATTATLAAGKLYARAITASVTSTATLAKGVAIIRSVSQATSLALAKAVAHAMSLSQATVATLSKAVAHGVSLSQATAATILKAVSTKLAAATQATVATLTSIKVKLITLTASQATVAAIAKTVGATRSVAQASSAVTVKGVQLARSVGQATSPALAKSVSVVRSVAQSESLTLLHTLVKFVTMTVSQATVVTLSKSAQLMRSVAQASSSTLRKSVGIVRQVSQASSLAMTKALTVTRAIAQASVATLAYGSVHHLVLTAAQATTATLRKSVGIVRAALQALSSALATVVTRFTQRPVADHIFLEYSEGRVRVVTSDGRARLAQEEGRARVDLQDGTVRAVFEQGTIRVTLERQ